MRLTSTELREYSLNNPGALSFLVRLDTDNADHQTIINTLMAAPTIKGPNLYTLWSDLANKNLDTLCNLCRNVPIDILIDACSREDYSGQALIAPFVTQ